MKKIVMLGCENSHSRLFLDFIKDYEKYHDVEVIGVYSHEDAPMQNLADNYGVKKMSSYDEFVDDVDGIVVTARHGDNHYKYAAPYIKKGVPMFIDKPITIDEEEAVKFMRECRENGVRITGGSCCIYDKAAIELKEAIQNGENGRVRGGFTCAPASFKNDFGGFFFYTQHLVAVLQTVFGMYPESVQAFKNGTDLTVVFHYDGFDVSGLFAEECYNYATTVALDKAVISKSHDITFSSPCFVREFDEFYKLLSGEEQVISYKDFISPVHILNAIARSMESGKEEKINYAEI